jgi:uncharacterized membrane protein
MNTLNSSLILALAFGIGVIAGLRALTAPAVVSWAAYLHWINLQGTHLAFMGSIIAVAIFTLAAAGEIVNDKLPKTPPRTALPSVVIRVVMGAFAAATLSAGMSGSIEMCALLGLIGAVAGTFGGYYARTGLVKALKSPDWPIALLEDAIAVCGGLLLASRL